MAVKYFYILWLLREIFLGSLDASDVIPIRIIIDNVVVFGILPVCEDILEQMRIVAG